MQEKFMREALKEAKKAYDKLEVPVGAVIVKDDVVISQQVSGDSSTSRRMPIEPPCSTL